MTMSSTLRTFGGAPTDKWGSYNWNAFKWGEGTTTITQTVRMLVNPTNLSVASTQAVNYRFNKLLTGQTITPSDHINFFYSIGLSETLASSDGAVHLYVQDPNGYFRVFHEGVTDLLDRTEADWDPVGSGTVTWSTAIASPTVWS